MRFRELLVEQSSRNSSKGLLVWAARASLVSAVIALVAWVCSYVCQDELREFGKHSPASKHLNRSSLFPAVDKLHTRWTHVSSGQCGFFPLPCAPQKIEWLGSPELSGLSKREANEKYFRGREYIAARDYDADFPWGVASEYRPGQRIGKGAFSSVYKALHLPENRTYAVKVLDAADMFRFVREVDVSLRMRFHPRVITVYDAFQLEDGRKALVMDYIEDIVPIERVKQEISLPSLRRYLYTVLHVLAFAKENKVLHRDLDLENVFIDGKSNSLFVADWGASKFFEEESHATNVGADGYRAPELLLQNPYYDYSADIWSVGALFLELLMGREPIFKFDDDESELFAISQVLGTDGFHELLRRREIYCPPETVLRLGRKIPCSWVSLVRTHKPGIFILEHAVDLLDKMLRWLPEERITVAESLKHPFLRGVDGGFEAELCPKGSARYDFLLARPNVDQRVTP